MTISELMTELEETFDCFKITPSSRWYTKTDIEEKMERMKEVIERDIEGLSDKEKEATRKLADRIIEMIVASYTAGYEKGDSDRLEYEM